MWVTAAQKCRAIRVVDGALHGNSSFAGSDLYGNQAKGQGRLRHLHRGGPPIFTTPAVHYELPSIARGIDHTFMYISKLNQIVAFILD